MREQEKLQCLAGKHPFVDVGYRSDGLMIFRVKTPDDRHHLTDLPIEVQDIVLDWIFWNFLPAQKLYPHQSSYSLKHVLQKRTQIYLSNNQFKEAMLIHGFWPRDLKEMNWYFYIQASSPAIKPQADGYSGLPIIGRPDLDRCSCQRR